MCCHNVILQGSQTARRADKLHCGDLLEVVAVMARGKTLIKKYPHGLGRWFRFRGCRT